MKSLTWSLIYISTTILQHLVFAQVNNDIALLNAAIEQDLDIAASSTPMFRASDDTQRNNINNMVLYWGQGDFGEKRLSYYCDQEGVSIVVIGFVVDFIGGPRKSPILNLSDNCNNVENCIEAARDIKYCQKKGIKVLMSVGGAAGPYHKQNWDPDLFAWWMWNKFLGGTDKTVPRPFGDAILDGVDYDPESVDGLGYDRHIDTLRQLYKTQYPPREYLITAAPQCPDLDYYPKNAVYNILHPAPKYDAYPDMVFVQFYNNYCSASAHQTRGSTQFNFDVWDTWAQQRTKGRTKIYLGVLGKENHMDTGYVSYEKLTVILDDIRRSRSFGGVMIWDAGYAYSNTVQYLNGLTYGQATFKYLDQLNSGNAKTAKAFDSINMAFKDHRVPILVPLDSSNSDLPPPPVPCTGLSFLLLRSVSGRVLASSLGSSADSVDQHLESIGMDGDDPINPGSRICLISNLNTNSVVIGYVYNASIIDDQELSEFYI
ncbi:hypothetical protein [Parasitella parasitica]|uniref:GH18 domain-containing protein n=1 Tax=Parasitella parasitica TaxID=35722 RepID=A0A0B7NBI2_9FUNG|nr:hypothetical protein [Parasitella parasitica]